MSHDRTRSASAVALLADIPSTGHLGGVQAQRFTLDGPDLAAQSGVFVDYARHHAAQGTKIVALYPDWRGERARRAVAFARGALRDDSVAAVGLGLSPLALSLIADQLAYLSPYLPAGMIAGLAQELPRYTLAGGWLRSVANLAAIPTSVPQHLGSFAPGVTYLALCSPIPQVARVPKGEPATRLPFRPQDPVQVLHSSGGNVDTAAFEAQFLPALGAVASRRLPAQPLGPIYWGSPKYVEFVAFSAHPRALTEPARTVRPAPCAWCAEPTVTPVCRFCGAANTVPAQRPHSGAPAAIPSAPAAPAPAAAPASYAHPPAGPRPGPPQTPARPAPPAPQPDPARASSPVGGRPEGTPPPGGGQPPQPHRPRPPAPVEDEDLPVPQALPPLPEDPDGPPPGGHAPSAAAHPGAAPPRSAPPALRLHAPPGSTGRPVSALPSAGGGAGAPPPSGPAADHAPDPPAGREARHPASAEESSDPRWAPGVSVPRAPR
ncbi:hypothetical protein [Streptomonospora sp. PA3]|uniref:hypothetical protein n=1 Tax=Streptomonospora sp. PA3 TaxID=2607326 RepID=UPI001642C910|nr:hypothetical protein [Streptomonospora sp. PA3]